MLTTLVVVRVDQMSDRANLALSINRARRESGLTVAQLARKLEVSRSVASDIVSGKRSLTPGIALRLMQILDLDDETEADLRRIRSATYTSSVLDATMLVDDYE